MSSFSSTLSWNVYQKYTFLSNFEKKMPFIESSNYFMQTDNYIVYLK